MANVTEYNAMDCVITVGGVYITGLGEDMVNGEKDEENTNAVVGAQGDVVVNHVNNSLGTITVTIQGTSPQKGYLLELNRSKAMTDIWVTNKSIGEKMGGSKAMVNKVSGLEQGAELSDREIEFKVFDFDVIPE